MSTLNPSTLTNGDLSMKVLLLSLLFLAVSAASVRAAVQTKTVTYTHDGVTCKGYLAWDDAAKGKQPAVLVVHEFWGLGDDARKRAEKLASEGYVAFAADMYGDGKLTDNPKEAGAMAGALRKDVKLWMGRANAALKVLQDQENVDPRRIAAIGYCFGGSTALQMAHQGSDIVAAVGFHAALPALEADQAKNIKAKILICHGALDTFIPED